MAAWFHGVTLLAFVLHIGGGAVALVSGFVAIFAPTLSRFISLRRHG